MIHLELVTLSGPKLQDDVYEVILPTLEGNIAVYAQHMPLVSVVIPGVVSVRRSKNDAADKVEYFATFGGVAEITGKAVRLLVDEAAHADEIIEKDTAEALERARKMKEQAGDQVELERAQALIDRERVRLHVAELRRRNGGRRTPIS